MAKGGRRPGAGRPKGGKDKPHILDYWTPVEVADFFVHIRKQYKKSDRIATWVGDQISGKPAQAITGPEGGPVQITVVKYAGDTATPPIPT